jgi:hypothetical protein
MKKFCIKCGRELEFDEIALHKKLCGKNLTEHKCISCLASHFSVTEELLFGKIEEFKKMGCLLFVEDNPYIQ